MSDVKTTRPTVLVVDDESDLVSLYEAWLRETCEVRTATSGTEALDEVEEVVDVVLLDRRMPDMTGDEVLSEIRSRDIDCRVAMLTAIEPEEDIVDMPFDDYVQKPVERSDLLAVIDILLKRTTYDEQSQWLFSLASRKAALEASPSFDHRESDEYHELCEELERARSEVDATLDDLMEHDYSAAFQELQSG